MNTFRQAPPLPATVKRYIPLYSYSGNLYTRLLSRFHIFAVWIQAPNIWKRGRSPANRLLVCIQASERMPTERACLRARTWGAHLATQSFDESSRSGTYEGALAETWAVYPFGCIIQVPYFASTCVLFSALLHGVVFQCWFPPSRWGSHLTIFLCSAK